MEKQILPNGYIFLGNNMFGQPIYLEVATGKRLFGNLF